MATIADEWKNRESTPLDFIVVGAGAAGAPLAARLAERGYTVLVLEMGPEKPPRPTGAEVENTEVPLLHSETTEDQRHSLRYFVKHFNEDPAGSLDPKVCLPENARRDEQGIFYPRAQGVGGCTIHNAMITICGPSEDWDEIAEETGDQSWRGERLRSYFQRVEQCHYDKPSCWDRFKSFFGCGTGWENARHGQRGWLDTNLADLRLVERDRQLLKVLLDGAFLSVEAGVESFEDLLSAALSGGSSPVLDPNHWETMRRHSQGVWRTPCSVTDNGERSGPRQRLLSVKAQTAHGQRLHILSGVCVTELLLEKATREKETWRATGVRCLPREHVYEADPNASVLKDIRWEDQVVNVYCRREVVLCGGAFNTPQLLMLSGIGPREHLSQHGIDVRCDLPGVGANLQDRYEVPLIAKVTDRFRSLDGICMSSKILDSGLKQWKNGAERSAYQRGPYATNGGLVSIFKRSSQECVIPDLVVFAVAGSFPGYYPGWSKPEKLLGLPEGLTPEQTPKEFVDAPRRTLTWLILKARGRNRTGYVRLLSKHPFRRPEINFHSFPDAADADLDRNAGKDPCNDADLEAVHEGVQFVKAILKLGAETDTIASHELPGLERFGGNVRKWIKHTAWGHHACGTCRIGVNDDPGAVLDSRFRVRGVRGLRLMDASVFPRIPGYFIVTNIYMIAEKGADILSEDHPLDANDLPRECKEALQLDPVLPSSPDFEARRLYPAEMEAAEARLIASRRDAAGL